MREWLYGCVPKAAKTLFTFELLKKTRYSEHQLLLDEAGKSLVPLLPNVIERCCENRLLSTAWELIKYLWRASIGAGDLVPGSLRGAALHSFMVTLASTCHAWQQEDKREHTGVVSLMVLLISISPTWMLGGAIAPPSESDASTPPPSSSGRAVASTIHRVIAYALGMDSATPGKALGDEVENAVPVFTSCPVQAGWSARVCIA